MPHRSAARLLAALLPAALLVPVAAHAERVVIHDPRGDVVRVDEEASGQAQVDVTVPAPRDATADVTRVVVDHGPDVLTITVDVRNLTSHFHDLLDVQLRSQQRLWAIEVLRSGRETYTGLTRGHRDTRQACGGLVTRVDAPRDAVVVSVPTTCIDQPRWVRVGVALVTADVPKGDASYGQLTTSWDEAGVRGFEDDDLEVRGPKVHRG